MKLLLIILLCVTNLKFGACSKCIFVDYGFEYTCNIDLYSSSRGEEHKHGKTDDDVKIIEIVGNGTNRLSEIDLDLFCLRFDNMITLTIERIEAVSDDLFEKCTNLKHLTITYSDIAEVSKSIFSNLRNLEWIYFNHNKLKELPGGLLNYNQGLTKISFMNSKFHMLPSNLFSSQINLIELNLQNNQISCLPPNIFLTLKKLIRLDLRFNNIHFLNPKWFENLVSLKYLLLIDNDIQDLPKNVFKNAKKLQEIHLRGNRLKTIHSNSFGTLENLNLLGLSNNKIGSIDEKILNYENLKTIWMNGNVCSKEKNIKKNQMKEKLQKCFDNYQSRMDSVFTTNIKCGTRLGAVGLIHRGTPIEPNDYPWNVVLVASDGHFFCGGTIVSEKHIVTAAHCMKGKKNEYKFDPGDFYVMLGVHNLTLSKEKGRTISCVNSIHVHPDWNVDVEYYEADIAILELRNEITFSKQIRPICIPEVNSPVSNANRGTAVGFGITEDGRISDIAKKLEIPIYTYKNCTRHSPNHRDLAGPRTFCGGWADGSGVCSGDDGSGVYVIHRNAYYLRGVVSEALPDITRQCDVNRFAVFTDVPEFYGWIKSGGLDAHASNRYDSGNGI